MTSIVQPRVREITVGVWRYAYNCFRSDNSFDVIFHEINICGQKKHGWKCRSRNLLDSQSRLDLVNRVDAIGAVSVVDGGVLLTSIVAEQ